MYSMVKKVACLLPPLKRAQRTIRDLREQVDRLTAELSCKNAVVNRLARIDSRYLLTTVRTSAPQPKEGEAARLYFIEIISHCDLACVLCAHGHKQLFRRAAGRMSLAHFEKILDKIKEESPSATVSPYHHCEPTLHPQLPEMLRAIKKRGFTATASFNWNRIRRLDEMLLSGIDSMEISISGFSQSTYEKSHIHGKIDTVKSNLSALKDAVDRLDVSPQVFVIYHMYKDNLGQDFEEAKKFAEELGFKFHPAWARNISLELTLLYLHQSGLSRYIPPHGQKSWFCDFPPLPHTFMEAMDRIIYLPQDYLQGNWKNISCLTCNLDRTTVNIRWTGNVNLCCGTFDDRLVMGDFLTMHPDEYVATRNGHPVCLECRANNALFYFQYADMESINKIAHARLDENIPANRRF